MFGSDGAQHVWREPGQHYHRGGSVKLWGCRSAKGLGEMTFTDGTMNACGYTKILADEMTRSFQKLGRRGIFQQDKNHAAKSHASVFKKSENYDLAKYVV